MQKQRAHHERATSRNLWSDLSDFRSKGPRLNGVQPSEPMGPRHHAQRAGIRTAFIQMHANGDERLEHARRRLHEHASVLLRPTGELGTVDPFLHWNAQVLVQ